MKKTLIPIRIGVLISGTGLLFMQIGGWGPCGPVSILATVGGILNYCHIVFYGRIFGELHTNSSILNSMLLIIIPACNWTLIGYFIIGAIAFIKGKKCATKR